MDAESTAEIAIDIAAVHMFLPYGIRVVGMKGVEPAMPTSRTQSQSRGFGMDHRVSTSNLQPSGIVWRPQVGELGKQIAVGLYLVPHHPPVCEDSQEGISGVVGERPAIAGE
jgi:hypothetical protein